MKTMIWSLLVAGLVSVSGTGETLARGPRLALDVSPANGVLKAGTKQTAWVRVGLNGFTPESQAKRPPVNLAIVLDKSGSMQGQKIVQARQAAIDALGLLGPQDIVSVVTYDSTVNVVVPATKLTDKASVIERIRSIGASGNTALFAGVSKGAAEVRKFLDGEHVNRVVLLSDGLANEGPSSPGELAALGASLVKENISVTTLGLGLGYNEDLMTQLALKSGGNHHFVEDAAHLVQVFRGEFNDVLSVVAQEVDLQIRIPEGIRPVRVLGNDADINGQQILTRIAQIYGGQDRYLVLELEVPEAELNSQLELAAVEVSYTNLETKATDHLQAATKVDFSNDEDAINASLNRAVMADVVALVSSEQNKIATRHLDAGDLKSCRAVLSANVAFLAKNAAACESTELKRLEDLNGRQLLELEGVTSNGDVKANLTRKTMRLYQNSVDLQQRAVQPPPAPTAPVPAPAPKQAP